MDGAVSSPLSGTDDDPNLTEIQLRQPGIGAEARMVDWSRGFRYEGGEGASADEGTTLVRMVVERLRDGLFDRDDRGTKAKVFEVRDEVVRVMQR